MENLDHKLTELASEVFWAGLLGATKTFEAAESDGKQTAKVVAIHHAFPDSNLDYLPEGTVKETVVYLALQLAYRLNTLWAEKFMSPEPWMGLSTKEMVPAAVSRSFVDHDKNLDMLGNKFSMKFSEFKGPIAVCEAINTTTPIGVKFSGADGCLHLEPGAGQLRVWNFAGGVKGVRVKLLSNRVEVQAAVDFWWDPAKGRFYGGR